MIECIFVLEGPWDERSIAPESLWPFVHQFAEVAGVHSFHRSFSDRKSFRHWLKVFNRHKKAPTNRILYIATHGSPGQLGGLFGGIQTKTIFKAICKAKSLQGVHFGCCEFGRPARLRQVLEEAKDLTWAAGYGCDIEWVDSTLFDIIFWNCLLPDEDVPGTHFYTRMKQFLHDVGGLADRLQFSVAYRRGDVIELLEPPYVVATKNE